MVRGHGPCGHARVRRATDVADGERQRPASPVRARHLAESPVPIARRPSGKGPPPCPLRPRRLEATPPDAVRRLQAAAGTPQPPTSAPKATLARTQHPPSSRNRRRRAAVRPPLRPVPRPRPHARSPTKCGTRRNRASHDAASEERRTRSPAGKRHRAGSTARPSTMRSSTWTPGTLSCCWVRRTAGASSANAASNATSCAASARAIRDKVALAEYTVRWTCAPGDPYRRAVGQPARGHGRDPVARDGFPTRFWRLRPRKWRGRGRGTEPSATARRRSLLGPDETDDAGKPTQERNGAQSFARFNKILPEKKRETKCMRTTPLVFRVSPFSLRHLYPSSGSGISRKHGALVREQRLLLACP